LHIYHYPGVYLYCLSFGGLQSSHLCFFHLSCSHCEAASAEFSTNQVIRELMKALRIIIEMVSIKISLDNNAFIMTNQWLQPRPDNG
ncbi:hypothetical protein, partial [Anabaena sp. PCC 7938]|uniref:hypothetical protein n=1 Tax=Anabaena sp. PCC 7938 TaxID=1296340 RepID=UPI00202FFD4C